MPSSQLAGLESALSGFGLNIGPAAGSFRFGSLEAHPPHSPALFGARAGEWFAVSTAELADLAPAEAMRLQSHLVGAKYATVSLGGPVVRRLDLPLTGALFSDAPALGAFVGSALCLVETPPGPPPDPSLLAVALRRLGTVSESDDRLTLRPELPGWAPHDVDVTLGCGTVRFASSLSPFGALSGADFGLLAQSALDVNAHHRLARVALSPDGQLAAEVVVPSAAAVVLCSISAWAVIGLLAYEKQLAALGSRGRLRAAFRAHFGA